MDEFTVVEDLQEEPLNDTGKRLTKIFESEYMADFTITVQNSTFRCHKIIVAASSPKIAKMIFKNTNFLELDNVAPNHFRFILEIIYGCDAEHLVHIEEALAVGRYAHDLQVHSAVDHCSKILRWLIEPDTVCEILEFAQLICDEDLKETCIQFIREQTDAVLSNEAFISCKHASLELILSQKRLHGVTELDLFLACARWAEQREQPRQALGSVLGLIRFRILAANDFVQKVIPTKLLTSEEEKSLMNYFLTRRGELPVGFSNERIARKANLNEKSENQLGTEQKIRFMSVGSDKYISSEDLSACPLRFSVNSDMNLIGIKVSSCREGKSYGDRYMENISLFLKDKSGTLIASATFFRQVQFGIAFSINFPCLVPITPNITYSLQYKSNIGQVKHFTCEYAQDICKTNSNLEICLHENVFFPVMCLIVAPNIQTQ